MFEHTIRAMLIIACALTLTACELGGESGADRAALEAQLAGKDAEIASLQAQVVVAQGRPAVAVPETRSRLETVRARGRLVCAGRVDLPGFGYLDATGRNVGFDIDLCRAVAAAVLGNGEAVEIIPVTSAERGPTIQSGDVDLMARNVTWTTTREAQWGNFTTIMFYDGQGFMVPKASGIDSALKLGGTTVCVISGTTTELNLADFSRQHGLKLEAVIFEDTASVQSAYEQGRCDVRTSDKAALAAIRSAL